MTPARYLANVFIVIGALGAASAVYAWTEMGRETGNGFANCAYIARKIAYASRVGAPKLLIVAGSNAAAGIDASALAKALNIHTFNFSLFATFAPGFDLFQARKVLRKGDAVLLAFEYLAYEYEAPTNAQIDTVYTCGEDYWRSLDWPRRLRYVFAVRPQRFFSTLAFNGETSQRALRMVDAAIAPDGNLADPFPAPTPESNGHRPLVIQFRENSSGAAQITAFIRWAKANGIRVFATWPNTLYFKEYESNPAFAEIAQFYRSRGVEIIGTPRDAMVTSDRLAETIYHLTAPGIAERTKTLANILGANKAFADWKAHALPLVTSD
jgi:hypothetical protein